MRKCLVRRLRKSSLSSPANKDIAAFDLFESWQTNPVGLLRAARAPRARPLSLLLILICFYYVFSLAYAIFREKNKQTIAPGRTEKREEERVCLFAHWNEFDYIYSGPRGAADFL
jgi:hypothetical protein